LSDATFLDGQVPLEPVDDFRLHLRQILVSGVLVDHAAEVLALVEQAIDGAQFVLQYDDGKTVVIVPLRR
jgi:hypothetical protein